MIRGIHGSVFIKKITKPNLKKKQNRTETGSNRLVSVRFGFLEQKPVQTGLTRVFRFGSVFFGLARFFRFGSVFSGFFPFGFGSVQFF
jgi:hypothetical protein